MFKSNDFVLKKLVSIQANHESNVSIFINETEVSSSLFTLSGFNAKVGFKVKTTLTPANVLKKRVPKNGNLILSHKGYEKSP